MTKEGNRSNAICEHCREVVDTTFLYREVCISGKRLRVPNILAGVCNRCDNVVTTTPQATPLIRAALDILERSTEVLGSEDRAQDWMMSEAIGLGMRRPIDLIQSDAGRDEVETFLTRIEYGVYT